MEGRCSCDPAKHVFSAGCVYGDPQPTPPGCARVVVCRVATSPYKCSSEYHHIAETDMRGVNVLTVSLHLHVGGGGSLIISWASEDHG